MNRKKRTLYILAPVVLILDAGWLSVQHTRSVKALQFHPYSNINHYTVIEGLPGSLFTEAEAINDHGDIVGQYEDATEHYLGFRFSHGIYTTFKAPKSANDTDITGINDQGDMAGIFEDGKRQHGFLLSHNVYTTIDPPKSQNTRVFGINNQRKIVGVYTDSAGKDHNFILSRGVYAALPPPRGTAEFEAQGINDMGEIIGYSGLLFSHGAFKPIAIPGLPKNATFNSRNDAGAIVGEYRNKNNDWHGFIIHGQSFRILDAPESKHHTYANGINNHGQIVGTFTDSAGTWHSFLRNP